MKTQTQQRITRTLHAFVDVLIILAIVLYMLYIIVSMCSS